jgi:cytochrome c oxidase subunit 2
MIQDIALYASLALMALLALIFAFVLSRPPQGAESPAVQARASSLRGQLFWIACAIGVVYMLATLVPMPIPAQAAGDSAAQRIEVTGAQWRWELSGREVHAGEPVAFLVTSKDVNHGLGLYNADLVLLTQAQAMPGYVNRLVYTFAEPGTYTVRCLEYCGLAHHGMSAEITVLPPRKG